MSEASQVTNPLQSHVDELEAATQDFEPETRAIIGAAIEVHRTLGPGFLEAVYAEALRLEFQNRGIAADAEVALPIWYKGQQLRTTYRADFVCYGSFIVELKAHAGLGRADEAQVVNYLRATGQKIGLLFNFAALNLQIRRLSTTRIDAHSSEIDFPGFPSFSATPGSPTVS